MDKITSYFSPSFAGFFDELSGNNNTRWFDQHRKTYEQEVKKPFAAFVEDMIHRIKKFEPEINIRATDAVFRINQNNRSSGDKAPYNTFAAAIISANGKKDKSYPGFHLRFSHEKLEISGGSFSLDAVQLAKVRKAIAKQHQDFVATYNDQEFKEKFGLIQGEKSETLPDEYRGIVETEPLIANRQFYYRAELLPEILLIDNLPDTMMEFYLAGKKLNDFLKKAMKN